MIDLIYMLPFEYKSQYVNYIHNTLDPLIFNKNTFYTNTQTLYNDIHKDDILCHKFGNDFRERILQYELQAFNKEITKYIMSFINNKSNINDIYEQVSRIVNRKLLYG